jgi:hypothetical protein
MFPNLKTATLFAGLLLASVSSGWTQIAAPCPAAQVTGGISICLLEEQKNFQANGSSKLEITIVNASNGPIDLRPQTANSFFSLFKRDTSAIGGSESDREGLVAFISLPAVTATKNAQASQIVPPGKSLKFVIPVNTLRWTDSSRSTYALSEESGDTSQVLYFGEYFISFVLSFGPNTPVQFDPDLLKKTVSAGTEIESNLLPIKFH